MTIEYAHKIMDTEIAALEQVKARLDTTFVQVLDAMAACEGRVVTSGMGKAGLIARKVSTTLASTGTTSFYIHPAEAMHGDLGMLRPADLLMVFSNSGESRETTELLPFVRMLGAKVIAITGNDRSALALHADYLLCYGRIDEACPLGLAPSATTTAMLALGDALALCLMQRRGFQVEDYARLHPGGALGRKTLPVEAVMRVNEAVAKVRPDQTVREAMLEITRARSGAAVVVDNDDRVLGVFTDGDLRRGLEREGDFLSEAVGNVMTTHCTRVQTGQRAGEVLEIMNEKRIGEAPVVDAQGRLAGVADLKGMVASL